MTARIWSPYFVKKSQLHGKEKNFNCLQKAASQRLTLNSFVEQIDTYPTHKGELLLAIFSAFSTFNLTNSMIWNSKHYASDLTSAVYTKSPNPGSVRKNLPQHHNPRHNTHSEQIAATYAKWINLTVYESTKRLKTKL